MRILSCCLLATFTFALAPEVSAQTNFLTLIRKIQVDDQGTKGACDGCAFNHAGSVIAASDNTGLTKFFDVTDGSLIRVIRHNEGEVSAANGETNVIHFSPDDQFVLTGMNKTGAKIWDLSSGEMIKNIGHGKNTDGAAFAPNGKWVAIGHGKRAVVYSLSDDAKLGEFSVAKWEVNSVDWSSDSSIFVLCGDGHDVKIVRTDDWTVSQHIKFPTLRVKTVRLSPDASLVVASGQDGKVLVYDAVDGRVVADLKHSSTARCLPGDDDDGKEPNVETVAWSPCGKYLFSGGLYDGVIRVWRVADWSLVGWAQGQEYSRQIEALAISKDNILAAGGDEGMVYLFQFSAPAEKLPIRQTGDGLICIEGEDFDVSVPQGGHWWSAIDDDTASGKMRVQCFPDVQDDGHGADKGYMTWDPIKDSPRLDYRIHFETPGVYHIWTRGKSHDHYGNSFHMGLNGEPVKSAERIECLTTAEKWVWETKTKGKNAATIEIKQAGPASINIWMREDGMEIDKLVLNTDESYSPEELGPEPTPRNSLGK